MSTSNEEQGTLDPRVNRALQEFLERKDRGEAVDHEQFLASHLEIADQLRSFIFDSEDLARRAAPSSRPAAEVSTNQSLSETIAPVSPGALPVLPEVFGRYRLLRLLGRGAMGAVYLAQDTQLSRQVAIKVPNFDDGRSPELLQRFYVEARSAATLRNPHICPVYDVGEINGQHYISMAYIEGHPLSEVIRANGPQPERQVLLLIRKLALALQEAHNQGVIHRDLKPGNVIIDSRGEPVVMDFGLACQTREGAARITHSGVILGSPAYMSPEQLEGVSGKISPAADQYSLGVIFYELLTGELPFRGSISAVISQIVIKPAPSPRVLRPDLDPRVDQLCLQMLDKSSGQRLSSMKAVADRIAVILKEPPKVEGTVTSQATKPKPTSSPTPSTSPRPTNPGSSNSVTPKNESPPPRAHASDSNTNIQHLSTLCLLAGKLIRKHDYAQAVQVLSSVPVGSRTTELSDLLQDAEDKEEESNQLLKDIDLAIRTNQPKELSALVRRFLQLKPGNKAVLTLSKELQKFGAAQVINLRRKQRHFLDPAGQVWNPLHLTYFIVGLGLFCMFVYCSTIAFQTANGTVIIEVHDPRLAVSFANDEITATSSGKTFRLKTTEKKTLQLEIDGVLVDSSTQEITVGRNETKLITARLVEGKIDLQINNQQQRFPVGDKSITKKGDQRMEASKPGDNSAAVAASANWIDLLPAIDPDKASGSITRWKREGTLLTGTIVPAAKVGWIPLKPPQEIQGDYDLELDFLIVNSNYMQLALPLNETYVTVALADMGTGLQWIDNNDINWGNNQPPHGNSNLQLRHGIVQHFTASVRHQDQNVTVETKLDGGLAGSFTGPRSRLSTPQNGPTTSNQFRLVAEFKERKQDHRIEIHKARVRLLKPATPSVPTTTNLVNSTNPNNTGNVLLDVDFQKSHGNFNQSDQDFLLAEHKDGEYRYMGKKPGWWYGPLHPEFWRKENNQVRDFVMELDLRIVGNNKGLFAIEFGQSGDGTLSLCVDQVGQVSLLHGGTGIVPSTSSPALRAVDQFNTLRLTVENKIIKVAVNSEPLFEKRLERYAGGPLCLWVGPDEVPFDVRIRRIRLERIGEKPPQRTQEIRRFQGHTAVVRGVAFLPDGLRAVSVGHGQAFKLWDVKTGALLHDFVGHTNHVTSISVSQDGRRALTGCWDTEVRLWDLENRTLLKSLKGHSDRIGSVLLSRDGLIGLSVSNDGEVRQWDLKTGRSKLLPGPAPYGVLAMSRAENLVASGAGDGTILLRSLKGISPLTGHGPGYVEGLVFTPDGSNLVTGGDDGTVRVWDLKNGKELQKFETDGVGFDTVVVTKDGKYVIAGSCDHTIVGWDLGTGKKVATIHADMPVTHRLALSPDNQYVLSGGGDRTWKPADDYDLRLWKLPAPLAPSP